MAITVACTSCATLRWTPTANSSAGDTSGSANAQNREIQEATFGFNQTFWKNPKYGAVQFMGQYSYLTRVSLVCVGQERPANANINMVFFNLRYALPGSAPTMGK